MKTAKKFHLNQNLASLITDIAVHYDISQSVLVEELLLSVLVPDAFYIQTTLIKNDSYFDEAVKKYLEGDNNVIQLI